MGKYLNYYIWFIINCLALFSTVAKAQTLPFKWLLNEDGLQNNNVHCILEDSYGYLWFGTENGLHRYNGIDFTLFEHNPNDANTLSGNVIFKIIEDQDSNMYISTNNGFDKFDRINNKFISIPAKFEYGSDSVVFRHDLYSPSSIATSKNEVYASLGELGIFLLNTDSLYFTKLEWLTDVEGLPLGVITSFFEDYNGNLWMGSQRQGLFNADLQKKTHVTYNDTSKTHRISSNNIYSIYRDSKNRFWLGNENGLNFLNEETNRFEIVTLQPPKGIDLKVKIYNIWGDKEGNVWFGSDGCGLYLLNNNDELSNYTYNYFDKSSLSSNFIRAIYKDKQNNIWIGTREGGISYVLNNNALVFKNYREKHLNFKGVNYRSITSICKSNQPNKYYLGTDGGGIDMLDLNTNEIEHFQSVYSKSVLTIRQEGNILWFGGYLEGLTKYDLNNNLYTNYKYNEFDETSLGHNDVRFILNDKQNSFWVATNGGGLNHFNPKTETFTRFNRNVDNVNSIVSNYCITLFEDKQENLWIGTYNGFSILDSSRQIFQNYFNIKNQNSISGNWVYCFHLDSKERMWIGTNFGLNLFDKENETFTVFLKENGLPGNEIMGIIEDGDGKLWISTNNGLCQFDVELNQFIIFDTQDGLLSNQFNHGAFLNDSNNTFAFGSGYGLTVFNPKDIRINKHKPSVYITNINTTKKSIPFNTHNIVDGVSLYPDLEIPYREASVIEIDFDALNYINSKKNKFRYFLEGFDTEWHDVGNNRIAAYNNLEPGTYSFKVIASNNTNVWNNLGAAIDFTIKPPLYKTLGAKIIYYLIVFLIIYILWRVVLLRENYKRDIAFEQLKREKTEEIAQMKTDFFVNISHELSTPLTLIIVPLQRIFDLETFDKSLLSTALNNSKRLLKLVRELLDFQKVEEGKSALLLSKNDIVLFTSEIVRNFDEAFKEKNIDFVFRTSANSLYLLFDTEKMEKVLYNLISNALKYTPANGTVTVNIDFTQTDATIENENCDWVSISVKDTGIGIHKDKMPFIFDKYYRIQPSSVNSNFVKATGYGIGLYTTKLLTELQNGQLFVESEEGVGSVFTIKLPALQHEVTANVDYDAALVNKFEYAGNKVEGDEFTDDVEETSKNPLVLIIEDNKELSEVLVNILSTSYQIKVAYDGQRGVQLATRYLPDLIITDIMMPIMDGIEVCEKIKTDFYTSHIPVVILTALNSNDYRLKGYKTGADDYISKPFDSKILEIRVKNLIDSRKNLHRKFVTDLKVTPGEITVTSADEEFLEKAIAAVENNIENSEFSVSELASLMNMSEATLYRKVKAITSQSPNIFIRTIRFKRAAQLLKTTKYSITEIVDRVGLNDVKYFRKCFQQQFGQNPLEFSKNSD